MTRRWVVAAVVAAAGLAGATAIASPSRGGLTSVPNAQDKAPGMVRANLLSRQLTEAPVAQGALKLDGGTSDVPSYGYLGNGPMVPAFGSAAEAQKTEPDKNTYLRCAACTAPTRATTTARTSSSRATRPGAGLHHPRQPRRRRRAPRHAARHARRRRHGAAALRRLDLGPVGQRLLFTAEDGRRRRRLAGHAGLPVDASGHLSGVLGSAGYEGIQNDVAATSGSSRTPAATGAPAGTNASQPNSFVYRFMPTTRAT